MRRRPTLEPGLVLALLAGVAVVLLAAWIIRPIRDPLVGSDTASSVLYFERLVAGERLERFLGTTPKPALTVLDGLLHAVGGWTLVAWVALVVGGLAVAATVSFATRTSGLVAGAFVGAALVVSPGLLQDLSLAYAVTWALLSLSMAALALTGARPHHVQAGMWLALGGLARQEVLIVAGVAALVVAGRAMLAATGRSDRPDRGEWWLLLGLAALPITAIHDLLLTGDPSYTWRVPTLGAVGQPSGGPAAALETILAHTVGLGAIAVLAVLGLVVLARRRRWVAWLGLVSIIGGVSAVILVVGSRGLVVLERYGTPLELACIVAAGFGLAAIRVPVLDGRTPRGAWTPAVVAAVVAIAITPSLAPFDATTTERIARERQAGRDLAALLPALRAAIAGTPVLRTSSAEPDATSRTVDRPALFVTPRVLSQAAVDLDLRLDHIARSTSLPPDGDVAPGTLVLHLAGIETTPDMAWTRIDAPGQRGGQTISPAGSVGGRAWLVRFPDDG